MIMTVDIGNSNVCFSVHNDTPEPLFLERIHTDRTRTAIEYAVTIRTILKLHHIEEHESRSCALSSVVPQVTAYVMEALQSLLDFHVIEVNCGLDLGFTVDTKDPSEVGTDILCDAAGALIQTDGPVINIDMGTATVVSMVDARRVLRGVIICPGVRTSLNSLSESTSALPDIGMDAPEHAIGTNTVDAMKSGIIFGTAGMLDRIIQEIEHDAGESCSVFATGGCSPFITPYIRHKAVLDSALLMKGLYSICLRNM